LQQAANINHKQLKTQRRKGRRQDRIEGTEITISIIVMSQHKT
jgi:hypothetical protein